MTLLLFLLTLGDGAQSLSMDTFKQQLAEHTRVDADPSARNAWLDGLIAAGRIPFIDDARVIFVYREEEDDKPVRSVWWLGDFNNWGKRGKIEGKKHGKSNIWTASAKFPLDARLDYKVVINGDKWMLDPHNTRIQVGGFGPNTEMAMPNWKPSPYVTAMPDTPKGKLGNRIVLASKYMSYDVAYRVYTPAQTSDTMPVIYFTDGHEYAYEDMGSATLVLDNLMAAGKLPPSYMVFIDPRNPRNGDNRRTYEYAEDYPTYAQFITKELVPKVEADLKVTTTPKQRVLIGTSLGGLITTWVGVKHGDVFGRVGIHSPAYWVDTQRQKERIKKQIRKSTSDTRFYVLAGTVYDVHTLARPYVKQLQKRGFDVRYDEAPQGHSWGLWRHHMADTLLYLLGDE